ncbi:MAG: glycosyltransferase family 2 protein [Armatimonadota bacterium]|nr:glycosyltransferase family 2 protein [Armatimonadota bacterium]MDR7427281.1 glycosyltransferase family 2 protein [Armatimonadota bacterium]MDR7463145.1 glycosyltransferase family 2 protein [Armatimonadota bacterium]MDR7468868.1 glycosyltransferase family 2 protein [Armatimonadota bacterium]MDR7474891.1 glycosyltransferase family 2 protein [Armatimonadota bacterium]
MNVGRVLVVIPLFNEEGTLAQVLAEVRRAVPDADILVVNDGSTDRSAAILAEAQAQDPALAVITHRENKGYGQSLIDGFAYALARGYDAVVTIDCDAQHEPRQIPQLLAALAGADIVSGSRYLDPGQGGDPPPADRLAINRETTVRLRELTGYPLTDAWCGFKAYRVSALRRLRLSEPGYGMPLQVWIQAARHGLRVAEVAVPRIYKNPQRRFWGGLDDAAARRRYYQEVLERELREGGPVRVACRGSERGRAGGG